MSYLPSRWLLVADVDSVHTRRLAEALRAVGVEVHTAGFSTSGSSSVYHHLLPAASFGDARYGLAVVALKRLIDRLQPVVVNAHYVSSYGLTAALAGAPRLVQTAWGTDLLVTAKKGWRRALARFALRRAVLATGDSYGLLGAIAELAPHVPRHRFVFGPPQSLFTRRDPKSPVIVSPRRHEPNYQLDLVLKSWEFAHNRLPGWALIMAGSGSLTGRLASMAGESVSFTGELPYASLMNLVASAGLVISLPRSDASSAAVLESLALGTPVLATDLDANREWLSTPSLVSVDASPEAVAAQILIARSLSGELSTKWSIENQVSELLATAAQVR